MQNQTCKMEAKAFFIALLLAVSFDPVAAKEFKLPEQLGPKEFDNKIIEHFLNSGEKGILTAFKGDPEMRGTDLQLSFWLEENTPFTAKFLIVNATDDPLGLMILSLIDYHQQEFRLNNHMASLQPLTIKPGERTIATIELPPLGRGAHDFILLAIKNKNPAQIFEEPDDQFLFHRANIFVGDLTFPKLNYGVLGAKRALVYKTYAPVINLRGDYGHFEPLLTDKLGTDQTRKYFVHINNPQGIPMKSALVTFLNGKQIPISHETGHEVLYSSIPAKRQDTVPVILKAPGCQAGCELLVLSIDNPYFELEPERGVMAQLPTRVRAANRLTIYSGSTSP